MTMFELKKPESTTYTHHYITEQDTFKAILHLNVRDAMVFCALVSLPQKNIAVTLKAFLSFLQENYGAKTVFTVPAHLRSQIPDGILAAGDFNAQYLGVEHLETHIEKIKTKEKVKNQLIQFEEGKYALLKKEDLKSRIAELNTFKITHAPFIDETKINYGQFSRKAEEEKLNNPHTEAYAVTYKNQIVLHLMQVIHGSYAYFSDMIVDENFRNKGLAQALMTKVYDEIKPSLSLSTLQGVWFVAGGHGALPQGLHLTNHVLPTASLKKEHNPDLQKTLGLYLMFGKPGPLFLNAANRHTENFIILNENDEKTEALNILKTTQRGLDKQQPLLTTLFSSQAKAPEETTNPPEKNPSPRKF